MISKPDSFPVRLRGGCQVILELMEVGDYLKVCFVAMVGRDGEEREKERDTENTGREGRGC